MLLLALLAALLGEDLSLSGGQWAAIAGLGALSIGAYAGFYKALELGPIAIVSPIASSNGAMIVVLAVIVLGESLTAVQALGIALVLGFIVLASVEPAAVRLTGTSGIRLALAATVVFGLYLFALTTLTDDLGWLLPILLTRAVAVTLMVAFFASHPDGDRRPLGRTGPARVRGGGRAGRPRLSDVQPRRGARRGRDHERGRLLLSADPDPGRADRLSRAGCVVPARRGGGRAGGDGRPFARLTGHASRGLTRGSRAKR